MFTPVACCFHVQLTAPGMIQVRQLELTPFLSSLQGSAWLTALVIHQSHSSPTGLYPCRDFCPTVQNTPPLKSVGTQVKDFCTW